MPEEDAVQVHNQDVVGLYNRVNRFITELQKSASGDVSSFNDFDQTRLSSYLDAIVRYHDWVVSQPHLDLPETAPRLYDLEPKPEIVDVENEDINDAVRLLIVARDELTNSQSARMAAQLTEHDSGRFTAVIQKARNFLTDYIAPTEPLDLPESSPMEPSTGPGRTGVNPQGALHGAPLAETRQCLRCGSQAEPGGESGQRVAFSSEASTKARMILCPGEISNSGPISPSRNAKNWSIWSGATADDPPGTIPFFPLD